ncbi:MAG: hypothetical protein AAGU74_08230 [Bacillota bacterium]
MKKRMFVLFIMLVTFVYGCANQSYNYLSRKDDNLSASMHAFYDAKDVGYGEGERFSIKLLEFYKVRFSDPGYDTPYNYYLYRMVIAPRTDLPMNKLKITFIPQNGLTDYFAKSAADTSRPDGFNPKNEALGAYPEMHITEKEKLLALDFLFYFSNLGDVVQQKAGISDKEFDKGMSNLEIKVDCDGYEEVITLTYSGELNLIADANDPIAQQNKTVHDLVAGGSAGTYTGEYSSDTAQ